MSGPVVFALRAILAAVLYFFLAWALFTLWQEIKQQSVLLASRRVPPISLAVRSGGMTPKVTNFHQPEVTIGRNPDCECPLSEDSISSRHARLSFHHGQWWLEDLGSKNGTWLNNERLLLPTIVVSGDQFRCGETDLVIGFASDMTSSTQELPHHEKKR
jgi:FHA domain